MTIKDWDAAHRQPPKVPRPELAALAHIADSDARFYLRNYLRSNMPADQDIARARCQHYGVDYETARAEARMT